MTTGVKKDFLSSIGYIDNSFKIGVFFPRKVKGRMMIHTETDDVSKPPKSSKLNFSKLTTLLLYLLNWIPVFDTDRCSKLLIF